MAADRKRESASPPPPPLARPSAAPFDLLTLKRVVEVHVDGPRRQLVLLADVRGALEPVALPGGDFSLGTSNVDLVLGFLRMIGGGRFEAALDAPEGREIWVRSDFRSEYMTLSRWRRQGNA
jgi:hypothetical protein